MLRQNSPLLYARMLGKWREIMMELTENKKEKGIWKLPKNVRQIGEPGSSTRILIEDYAYTYLHQMAEQNLTCMKTAVLLGNAEDGRICIQAAVEADMGQDQKKWFTNEQWRDVFAEVQQWFSGLEVVGWFLSNPGFPVQLTEELRTLHEKHFPSDKHVLFLMDVMENDADFFIKSDVGLTAAPGDRTGRNPERPGGCKVQERHDGEKGTEQPEENADIFVYRKHLSGAGDPGDRCDYDE